MDSNRRSVSLPSALFLLRQRRGKQSHQRGSDAPAHGLGSRMVSASCSHDVHRGGKALSEECNVPYELDIEEHPDGTLAEEVSHVDLYSGSDYGTSIPQLMVGNSVHRALATPEILMGIINALDGMTTVPHEVSQRRRKPLSLRHAQLIWGNTDQAVKMWERTSQEPAIEVAQSQPTGVFACLLVNHLWYEVAVRTLESRVFFQSMQRWTEFTQTGARSLVRRPKMLVLHKLSGAQQVEIDVLSPSVGGQLEWLEFYTCPGLSPPPDLLVGGLLTKIVLPGCTRVCDRTLSHIAAFCPRLEFLDLRACELVTDKGIKLIARYCGELQLLNVGRTRGGENVTYKAIKHLARLTQVTTLGLAGCCIDDRALWELAIHRGTFLQRLSLNNCRLLTDASVPRILGYTPKLTVLEIRGCTQITNMRPLALFKRYRERQGQPPLIEGCEIIERRLQAAIQQLRHEISQRILADCQEWVDEADED